MKVNDGSSRVVWRSGSGAGTNADPFAAASIPVDPNDHTRAAIFDDQFKVPVFIDVVHHEIHEGDHFYIEGFTSLDTDGTLYVKLVTPDTVKWSHFTWHIESSGILETYLYEDATSAGSPVGMSGGVAVTPLNSNRNSSGVSGMTITSGVTAPNGTGTTISQKKVGATGFKSVSGGDAERSDEIILKRNTVYCRKFLSKSDTNVISFRASWYEHTGA